MNFCYVCLATPRNIQISQYSSGTTSAVMLTVIHGNDENTCLTIPEMTQFSDRPLKRHHADSLE